MKKLISVLLALVMALSLCATAWADDPVLSGTCGAAGNEANVSWALADEDGDGNYTLTISGTGAMRDYNGWRSQPWQGQADHITKFVVEDGVTTIGISATDGENMIEEYVLGKDVETINNFGISTYAAKTFTLNGNTHFKVVDGVLFNANGTTLFAYPGGRESIDVYEVPNGVTAVNGGAFNGAKMKKLIFGSGSIYVESWSFQGCTAEYMELNGTNLTGSESFRHLSKLKDLKISGGSIPGQFFCGVAWTGGPSTAAIEKIIVSTLPSGSGPFFLQNKLTTVDLSQCTNVSNASEGVFSRTTASKIAFYFDTAANATAFQSTSAYESSNAVFAVLNGGSIPSDKGYYEDTGKLTTPSKTGFDFGGWYASADFSGDKVENPVVGSTYYAKWVTKQCTVSFDPDGGSTVPAQNVDYNAKADVPATPPTKTGYTFAGWFAPGANTAFDFANTLITDDITLTAHWTAKQYNVTFNSDGGSTVPTQTVDYNTKATKPTNPTKSGYVFDGWFDAQGNKFDFNTVITGNVTLKAHWTLKTNNIGPAKNPYVKDNTKADTKTDGKAVKSGDTFDPGVALYAGMALVSAAGMAWTVRKRGE